MDYKDIIYNFSKYMLSYYTQNSIKDYDKVAKKDILINKN